LTPKLSNKNKPALVLSGGGVKAAAFHIGVCLALKDKGFKFAGGSPSRVADEFPEGPMTFKTYVGSSAGSIISSILASGYSIEAIIHAFTQGAGKGKFNIKPNRIIGPELKPITYKDIFAFNLPTGIPTGLIPNFFKQKGPVISGGLEVLLKKGFKVNGVFTTKNIEKYLREHVIENNQFSSFGVNLFIVATQLNHSRKVVFGDFEETTKREDIKYANFSSVSNAVAASASLPPAYSPYPIKNEKNKDIYFFDGEIRDTLSTHVAADHGCDLVIASYSIQPYHYNKEIGSLHDYGVPLIINQALYQVVEQKISQHIRSNKKIGNLLDTVNTFIKENGVESSKRKEFMDHIYELANYKKEAHFIYIHPNPTDYKMFFYDHFSLNPEILTHIVTTGYRAARKKLRDYQV